MQEHIRRAHPERYIAKLPATEESFHLMINTPPNDRPPTQPNSAQSHASQSKSHHSHTFRRDESSAPATPRNYEEYSGGTLFPAAAALAQLHSHKSEPGWDSEGVSRCAPSAARRILNRYRAGIRITKQAGDQDRQLNSRRYTSIQISRALRFLLLIRIDKGKSFPRSLPIRHPGGPRLFRPFTVLLVLTGPGNNR